jgi:putative resolvase
VEHRKAALAVQGCKIVVADPGVSADDLVRDVIGVLASICPITAAKHDPGAPA